MHIWKFGLWFLIYLCWEYLLLFHFFKISCLLYFCLFLFLCIHNEECVHYSPNYYPFELGVEVLMGGLLGQIPNCGCWERKRLLTGAPK